MSIIYANNIFVKQEYTKHSGGLPCSQNDAPAESFYVNHFIDIEKFNSSYFNYNTPLYYTLGGTLNYYNQDIYSVFTNVANPFIRYFFTANTESFGTGTTIKHDIYRIPYDVFIAYTSNTNTIIQNVSIKNNKNIQSLLSTPILTITASTTGITSNVYNLLLNEYQKKKGDYSFLLFQDYAQYFITTQFEFSRTQGSGYTEFYQLNNQKEISPVDYQTTYNETTVNRYTTITAGTFVGLQVTGNYFTYFLIPNKPKWQNPLVDGRLTTFTPTFYWSDTDDGNSFLLQVVYNRADSTTFSGAVYSYPINKESTNLSTNELFGSVDAQPWAITQKTTDVGRKYSVALYPNKTFWYRIGNVKELINIFGVRQQVITFSDIRSAITAPNSFNINITVASDSPYVDNPITTGYPGYLDDDLPFTYTLSGTVSGSIVTGATMQLIYPNGNYTTQVTNVLGKYSFPNLESGTYTLNTSYRGYQHDSRIITISGDTSSSFKISLLWDNSYDTWGKMANENYYI
jgi:hypothetical protein